MGTPWWVYLILLIGVITFWSVVRSILGQTRWRRIMKQDKFKVTALGRQQLELLPKENTLPPQEWVLLKFFASSEEGRCAEDIDAEILQKEVEDEFRARIYETSRPKGEMAIGVWESVFREMASSMTSSKEIKQTIASLEREGYVKQRGVSWG